MKRFLFLIALFVLVGGANSVKAEVRTDWNPSTAYGATWNSGTNTVTWVKDNVGYLLLFTGLTPEGNPNNTPVDLSKYQKLHYNITSLTNTASDKDGAYVELKIGSKNHNTETIKLREGEHDIMLSDWAASQDLTQMLEMTFQGTLTGEETTGSAVVTEFYLYTDRWEIQTQQQTVYVNALGSALSLSSVVSGNTLVTIASSDNQILYGKAEDGSEWGSNQILRLAFDDAMALIEGDDNTSYQFQIIDATEEITTLPSGLSKVYRIKAFKKGGTTPYIGPSWNGQSSFYLQEISWTYNVADGTNEEQASFFGITDVEGKENIYKITAYKKDGSAGFKTQIYNQGEWFFNVVTQTPKQVDVDVWVEVKGADTEDPGVPAVPEGWKSLITNGDLSGDAVTSFWTKDENGNAEVAVIDATAGRMNGRGIKVVSKDNAANEWGTQFFIKASEPLKEGQKLHIEFDYRADRPQTAATQVHRAPGNYNANVGSIDFTVNWQHFSDEFTITSAMCKQDGDPAEGDFYLQSFGLNLSQIKSSTNFYFDNIVMWTEEDQLKPQKVALQNAIDLGNNQSSYLRTTETLNTLQDAITAGEAELANNGATAESLTSAKDDILAAIAGLKLENGYTILTADMYKSWDSATKPTTGNDEGCDYVIGTETNQPYGNGSVPYLCFADLSTFDTFYILSTGGGLPRILLNRDVDGGSCSATESESHLIDNTNGNCMTWASKYFSTSGSNVTVDLKQLTTDKDFAHLHTIKTLGTITVSDMLLYRTITVGSDKVATFGCLYKNAKPNGVTAYAAKYANGKVSLTPVTTVSAGKGVIIEAAAAGSYAPTFDVAADETDSDLKVSNGTVVGDGSIYVLANGGSGIGFYKLESGYKVDAGKAYLEITDTPARGFIGIDEMLTGVNEVKVNKAVAKTGKIYNLNGQIVSKPTKGLYIVDGKVVSF